MINIVEINNTNLIKKSLMESGFFYAPFRRIDHTICHKQI